MRCELSTELGVPTTGHSHEDMFLALRATRYGVAGTGELALPAVQRLLSLDAAGVRGLLEAFHVLDTSGDGLLGPDEFTVITAAGLERTPGSLPLLRLLLLLLLLARGRWIEPRGTGRAGAACGAGRVLAPPLLLLRHVSRRAHLVCGGRPGVGAALASDERGGEGEARLKHMPPAKMTFP